MWWISASQLTAGESRYRTFPLWGNGGRKLPGRFRMRKRKAAVPALFQSVQIVIQLSRWGLGQMPPEGDYFYGSMGTTSENGSV